MNIKEFARETMLEAKLKVIHKAMEPVEPSPEAPFPTNSFHNWHETIKKDPQYENIVHDEFMDLLKRNEDVEHQTEHRP